MWEADDSATRWTHGLCAIPVLVFILIDGWLLTQSVGHAVAECSTFMGAIYLEFRLLRYAFTGRNCINRDDYD